LDPSEPAADSGGFRFVQLTGPWASFFAEGSMLQRLKKPLTRIVRDQHGGEVIEYALILGLIIVVAIVTITAVGGKVLARWQSVNSSM